MKYKGKGKVSEKEIKRSRKVKEGKKEKVIKKWHLIFIIAVMLLIAFIVYPLYLNFFTLSFIDFIVFFKLYL